MNKNTNILLAGIFLATVIFILQTNQARRTPPPFHWRYDTLEVPNDAIAQQEHLVLEKNADRALAALHDPGSFSQAFVLNTNFDAMVSGGWELFTAVPELGTKDGYTRTEKVLLIFRRPQ